MDDVAREILNALELLDNVTATDSTADCLGQAELALRRALATAQTMKPYLWFYERINSSEYFVQPNRANMDARYWKETALYAEPVYGVVTGNAWRWGMGDRLTKTKGSAWTGRVVGFYSTKLTPIGYAIESENEPGSVQIYPESALASLMGMPR